MNISFSKQAIKTINSMDSRTKARIKAAIDGLPSGDAKQIQRGKTITNRLRVGGWRILYNVDGENLVIEKIGPRGQVYKGV